MNREELRKELLALINAVRAAESMAATATKRVWTEAADLRAIQQQESYVVAVRERILLAMFPDDYDPTPVGIAPCETD